MASNNLITPWIAAHVEHCLGFYIGQTPGSDIELTDDGTSLIFRSDQSSFSALVAEWGLGHSGDGLVLIDADNQVEGFISKELFAASDSASSISQSPKKHKIELLDFSLVIPYSGPSLEVRLCINRFCIDWEGKEHKFTPKRKLVKNNSIKVLLDKALQKTRDSRTIHQSPEIDTVSARSNGPQVEAELDQDNPPASQIFSQVPARQHVPPVDDYRAGSSLLRTGASLLQHLNPFSAISASRVVSRNETPDRPAMLTTGEKTSSETLNCMTHEVHDKRQVSIESQTGDDVVQDVIDADAQNQVSGNSGQKECLASISSQSPNHPAGNIPESNEDPAVVEDTTSQSPSRKRRRGSPGENKNSDLDQGFGEQVSDDHLSKKKQKTNTTTIVPPQISPSDNSSSTIKKSADHEIQSQDARLKHVNGKARQASPWKWSGQIPLHEIQIPKDQRELLDDPARACWVPPKVSGSLPQGHVPPLLLSLWNNIAERRHRFAQEKQASPKRPATPDPGSSSSESDTDSESESEQVPWSPSPPRNEPAIQRLPPDSSPLKEKSPKRQQELLDNREAENRVSPDGVVEDANNTQQPEVVQNRLSPSLQETPLPDLPERENDTSGTTKGISPQDSQKELSKESDLGLSTMSERENSTQEQIAENQRSPSAPKNTPSPTREMDPDTFDSGDESDESMMDTSVPFALGGSLPEPSQSTQNEQDPISSGPPLPIANARQVQVFETPAMNNNRSSDALAAKDTSRSEISNGAAFSARQNHSSSQSRVFNTYPFHGSHEQTQSSNEDSHCSVPSNGSVQVKRTQPHSSHQDLLPHNLAQDQIPSEVVLDSSGPDHRHKNTSQSSSNQITEPSSYQSTSSHQPEASQPLQPTQDSVVGLSPLDQSGGSQISPLARFVPAANDRRSPFKEQSDLPHELPDSSQDMPGTQSAELIARRLGYLNNPMESLEAHVSYDKFRGEYKHYSGDFSHFSELCLKLKAVRAGGQLQKSFLWDDFIIMHLTQYIPLVEQQSSRGTSSMGYEEYFLLNYSNPVHKKRCLTLPAIDSAASQSLPSNPNSQITSTQSPRIPGDSQTGPAAISFTASLVNQFSKFHAHSFNDTSPSRRTPFNVEIDAQSSILQSPDGLPSVDINVGTRPYHVRQPSVEIKQEHSEEPTEGLNTQALPLSSYENSVLIKQEQDTDEPYAMGSCIANTQDTNDAIMEDAKMQPSQEVQEESSEESDEDESRHETASVELGDETFTSRATAAVPLDIDTIPEADSEAENEEENWFLALRRSRIPVPAWSDDPNTPFKRWAEADQNALVDRRRRGGAKILLDAKGVIRRPIHR